MTDELWDLLAEGAKWAKANKDVLLDAHWVGGDPGKAQVYGVAAWSPTKATLMFRNPSDQPQSIRIDPERAFELPEHVKVRTFTMKSPWAEDADKPAMTLKAGVAHTFKLDPGIGSGTKVSDMTELHAYEAVMCLLPVPAPG